MGEAMNNLDGKRLRLRLVAVERDRFVFEATVGRRRRPAVVLVTSSGTPEFPHAVSEGGLSLGRDDWDERVRDRVAELLVLRGAPGFGRRPGRGR
jgi:hypothetical protein